MTLDQKGLALNGCFKLYMPPSLMLQIFIRLYLPIPASEWQVLELSFNGGGMVKQTFPHTTSLVLIFLCKTMKHFQ